MPPKISPLTRADFDAWLSLAQGYKAFYQTKTTADEYATAWQRVLDGDGVLALGAFIDGQLVGITHYLFHTSTWTPTVCYLQDLFVTPEARGRGVARALLEAVADSARRHGATRLYWTTKEHNTTARALYDQVATFNGFIRYDLSL